MIPEDASDSGGLPAILDKGEGQESEIFKRKAGNSQVDRERVTLWLNRFSQAHPGAMGHGGKFDKQAC